MKQGEGKSNRSEANQTQSCILSFKWRGNLTKNAKKVKEKLGKPLTAELCPLSLRFCMALAQFFKLFSPEFLFDFSC